MDKIKINNQIVQMRKYVKQAKVHVINRLVKEVKLLQNRKGDENKVSKAKRKAERLLTEIALIKKMKPDNISKLAISKALDWNSVLQQKDASLEDRCISMLANYKPVQEEVESFHAINKELIPKIPECLKEWEEKIKEGLPKQSVKASDLRQKKKEKKSKLNKSQQKLNGDRRFSQVSQNSDSVVPKTGSVVWTSLREDKTSNSVDDGSNTSSHAEKKKEVASEQNEDVHESTNCLESNSDLQKLNIPLAESETLTPAPSSSNTDDDDEVDNSFTTFQNDNDSSSDEIVHESSTSAAAIVTNQEKENELLLENTEEKKVVYDVNRKDSSFKNSENKIHSDTDDTERTKHSTAKKKSMISPEKTKSPKTQVAYDINRIDNSFENSESKMYSDTDDTERTKYSTVKKKCMTSPEKTKGSNKSNNLKAIKQLNLDELKDFDEIPVIDSADREHSDTELKSGEESGVESTDEQESDPFFLREGETVSDVKRDIKPPFKNNESDASLFVRKSGSQKNNFNSFNSYSGSEKYPSRQEFDKRRFSSQEFDKRRFSSDSKRPENFKFKHENNRNDSKWTSKRKFSHTDELDVSPKRGRYQNKNVKNGSKIFAKNRETSFQEQKYTNSKDKPKSSTKKEKLNESLPIHPSWEAKRKLKETKNVQFQGKRMVFND